VEVYRINDEPVAAFGCLRIVTGRRQERDAVAHTPLQPIHLPDQDTTWLPKSPVQPRQNAQAGLARAVVSATPSAAHIKIHHLPRCTEGIAVVFVRNRFARSRVRHDPADTFGCLGTVPGDIDKRGRLPLVPTLRPTGPADPFGPKGTPAKIDLQVPLAARGELALAQSHVQHAPVLPEPSP
jgi:hypothetical protein